jgi:peptide deformylase
MPKILDIITNPNPKLRIKSKEIDINSIKSKDFINFCVDMEKTMIEKDGVGLAAPQVNNNSRIIIVNSKDGIMCMINPEIKKKSLLKEWDEEGCLSVPNVFGKVKRHKSIKCTYLNKEGNRNNLNAKGLLARVVQHEIDHLDGILFIDKAKNIEKLNNY